MPCYAIDGLGLVVDPTAHVHPTAVLIGDVIVGAHCYVGPCASLRDDFGRIELRAGANVQDTCVVHCFPGGDVVVEENGHVGHGAVLHGCVVRRDALVGHERCGGDGWRRGRRRGSDRRLRLCARRHEDRAARAGGRLPGEGAARLDGDASRPGHRGLTPQSCITSATRFLTIGRAGGSVLRASVTIPKRAVALIGGLSTVKRHWQANGLKPHWVRGFKVSRDPKFAEKLEVIVGLYRSPPEYALVLCCDEKGQVLRWTARSLVCR